MKLNKNSGGGKGKTTQVIRVSLCFLSFRRIQVKRERVDDRVIMLMSGV